MAHHYSGQLAVPASVFHTVKPLCHIALEPLNFCDFIFFLHFLQNSHCRCVILAPCTIFHFCLSCKNGKTNGSLSLRFHSSCDVFYSMSDPLRATSSVTTKSVYGLTADRGCEHRLASFHEVVHQRYSGIYSVYCRQVLLCVQIIQTVRGQFLPCWVQCVTAKSSGRAVAEVQSQ